MGGININQKHNLTINSKSLFFYILASLVLLTLLSFIIISIRISFLNAIGNEGTGDTGTATLNSVSILQAGTGQSVTIKGETLNENDYGTDNTTRRTILNNNVVRYSANYNVTTTGQITFSITLPANNTIDEATIAESQYCLPNLSKLEPADITNDDGTITKSYTNNKATCVRNITTTGSTSWQITAYLWGANNTKIQPTLAVSGQTSTVRPEEISVVGRGDYSVFTDITASTGGSNGVVYVEFYAHLVGNKNADGNMLGIVPIDNGTYTVNVDMSDMPDDWYVEKVSSSLVKWQLNITGGGDHGVVYSGNPSAERGDNGKTLTITTTNAVTGVSHCPISGTSGSAVLDELCPYSGFLARLGIPTKSLSVTPQTYTLSFNDVMLPINPSQTSVEPSKRSLSYELSSGGSGVVAMWPVKSPVGSNGFWISNSPTYVGQSMGQMSPTLQYNIIPTGDYSTNAYICTTWNPSLSKITSSFEKTGALQSNYRIQYGIIGTDVSAMPSSSQQYCGKVGDENIPGQLMFFDTLEEANQYAKDNNLAVNAMRLWSEKTLANTRDARLGYVNFSNMGNDNSVESLQAVRFYASITSDQWSADVPEQWYSRLTPGLLSHTLTAIPSSTNPGKEDHITITTKTYNKDTNSKITINLPNGLTPKEGSFTITTGYTHNDVTNTNEPIKTVLIEGENQDYTITANGGSSEGGGGSSSSAGSSAGNLSYTITLDLDHIASTHHVPITGYDPIYPGKSGVTNITLNSDTGLYEEVITTNNNNEDSDINNDDLPIAADNNGNGISHIDTPIEFDVTVNEDTPSPSTLTINSTTSGTGTDYASTTFKTASDTIAVAEPPKTFGYDLTASSNNIYAGDDLTYSYSISNTTDTNANDITMITVLPFNGDSRGTVGLMDMTKQGSSATTSNPYTITNLSLSLPSDGASGLDTSATKLYYTLDPKARELEPNPETLAADSSITWQELELDSNGNIPTDIMTNLQDQGILDSITALKLTTTTLPSSSSLKLNVTLDNILATTPGSKATLANDITYLSYSLPNANSIGNVNSTSDANTNTSTNSTSTNTNIRTILRREGGITTYSDGQVTSIHQNPNTVTYLGELLALSIPENEQTIQVDLSLNEIAIGDDSNLVNHLNLVTGTLRGYNLTAQASTEDGALVAEGNPLRLIPSISTKPTKGTAGWSAKIAGSNNQSLAGTTWTAIPGINQTPLNLYSSTTKGRDSRSLIVTYGISAAGTIAGTYSTKVVYTVVAEP